ncbi:MAG: hypothetical protein AAF713_00885 [Pseudomonadota bacterium]
MTAIWTIVALAVSTLGIGYLAATDAKRRRVFRRPPLEKRRWTFLARTAVFAPAVPLIVVGDLAALVIWMGAATVLGWGIAAVSPRQLDGLAVWLRRHLSISWVRWTLLRQLVRERYQVLRTSAVAAAGRIATRVKGTPDTRIEELEARIAALEERLAELEDDAPAAPIKFAVARSSR